MSEDQILVAEGKLAAFAIDFDHPEFCEFKIEGLSERFIATRCMARGISRSSVVLVAYRAGDRHAEVLGMIVLRCGGLSTERDRESLMGAVSDGRRARRVLRASLEWAEAAFLSTRSLGVADPAVVVDARPTVHSPLRRPLPGIPGVFALIFAAPREIVAADLERFDPDAARRLLNGYDPDNPVTIVVLSDESRVTVFNLPLP